MGLGLPSSKALCLGPPGLCVRASVTVWSCLHGMRLRRRAPQQGRGQPQPGRAQRMGSHSVPGVFNTLLERHLDVRLPVSRVSPGATAFQDSLSSSRSHLPTPSAAPPGPELAGPPPAFSQSSKNPPPLPALPGQFPPVGVGLHGGTLICTYPGSGRVPSAFFSGVHALTASAGPAVRTLQPRAQRPEPDPVPVLTECTV